eukprot:GHVU01137871.1.p1 GENE.GHVU01137871.1~~GHVU01137871.1.p1  ORF type:complete len:349 (-),score=41.34 GHVU01137871.1:2933-3979(-)
MLMGSFPPLFMADVATYYYRKFVGEDASGVALAMTQWLEQSWGEVRNYGLLGIWDLLGHSQEPGKRRLASLAVHLQTLPIQTAGAERLFSSYGAQKTKTRNRLHPHRVHKLSAVRMRVERRHRNERGVGRRRYRIHAPEELPLLVSGPRMRAAAMPRRDSESDFSDDHDALELMEFDEVNRVPGRGGAVEIDVEMVADQITSSSSRAAPAPEGRRHVSYDSGESSGDDAGEDAIVAADAGEWGRRTFGVAEAEASTGEGPQEVHWDGWEVGADFPQCHYSDGSEHRDRYPYPSFNDTNFPQETLTGLRAVKVPLHVVFPSSVRLPTLEEAYPSNAVPAPRGGRAARRM